MSQRDESAAGYITNAVLEAYFSDYPITQLSFVYDKVLSAALKISPTTDRKHSTQITKIVLSFLLETLVESGNLANYNRYSYYTSKETIGRMCEIKDIPQFCERLGNTGDYRLYTHTILYLIAILRAGRFPTTIDGVKVVPLSIEEESKDYLYNTILVLYTLLLVRLTLSIQAIPGSASRYDIEACMFATIISFYNDYVYLKAFVPTEKMNNWDAFYNQVETFYLSPGKFFTTLQLKYPLKAYLDQDAISGVLKCIVTEFLDKYKHMLTSSIGKPDINGAMTCLHNYNLNSLASRFNRRFRMLVNNAFVNNVKLGFKYSQIAYSGIKSVAKNTVYGLENAVVLGESVYKYIYSPSYPKASERLGIAVGTVAMLGSSLFSFSSTITSAVYSATVFAFTKDSIIPDRPLAELRFEVPKRPAYLVWEKSADGKYSVIYNLSPTPGVPLSKTSPIGFIQRGGSKNMTDILALKEALEKGYLKTELPVEMQIYIKNKLHLTTVMTGGKKKSFFGGATNESTVENDTLPAGYTREIIDNAQELAFIREDEDGKSLQLILPKPALEKEAMEKCVFTAVPEPAADIEAPLTDFESLPAEIPEKSPTDVLPIAQSTPDINAPVPWLSKPQAYIGKPLRRRKSKKRSTRSASKRKSKPTKKKSVRRAKKKSTRRSLKRKSPRRVSKKTSTKRKHNKKKSVKRKSRH